MIKAPRGTKDVLPHEAYKWQYVEKILREICEKFQYKEIRTPTFEHTELFERGVGETTDIVQKEMYTFLDRGGRSITLKPEGTAPAVRALIENNLFSEILPVKVYYITPVFRYEKPQAGRLREHHQFGVEVFGAKDASMDAEVISLAMTVFRTFGIKDLELRINSIGCPKCRREYNIKLREYLEAKVERLCETCKDRFGKNPMRIIDCKNEDCKKELVDIPLILDYICEECREHFEKLKSNLEALGLEYIMDPRIVRGLDYYNKTAFEIVSYDIGSQSTVCGGGRYDGLVEECGGPSIPGVGFGMGIERLLLTMENQGIILPEPQGLEVFVASIGERADIEAVKLLFKLRNSGISADKDYIGRSLKGQMRYADKLNTKLVVILGEDEIREGKAVVKDMKSGEQNTIDLVDLMDFLMGKLGRR